MSAQPTIKTSFASGEWAPKLRSRVDVQKYHAGAALLRNFFVDYSGGGASTRQGTMFVNQCLSAGARLVGFQPSTTISYVLEFGQNYIRFYSNGAPILEVATTISGATNANPGVITDNAHGYNNNDWVFISGVGGMTQLNGNYYIVQNVTTNTFTLTDLFGNAIDTTLFGTYTSGGTAQRVYTIASPYITSDLFPNQQTGNPGIKFVQDVTSLIICHPSYPPQILTIDTPDNWSLTAINFGPSVAAPTNVTSATSFSADHWYYRYLVTSVDNNGQESVPSSTTTLGPINYIGSTQGQNSVSWTAAPGAVSYNVYKTSPNFGAAPPTGSQFGFVGNVTGVKFIDAYPGINPDFSQCPPIIASPIVGGMVNRLRLTGNDNYTVVPGVEIAAAPAGGFTATAFASLGVVSVAIVNGGQVSRSTTTGSTLTLPGGIILTIETINGAFAITSVSIANPGSATSGSVPTNPVTALAVSSGSLVTPPTFNLTWDISALTLIQGGFGYTSAPAVTFTSGAATATATVTPISGSGSGAQAAAPVGNPRVPNFFQERLVLAGPNAALQSFYMSQPGSFFNFNTSNPIESDDGIFGSIISDQLNDIKNLLNVPTGLLALTGKGAWLLNGGGGLSTSNPITPSDVAATAQAFNGSSDLAPLKVADNFLFGTFKGSYIREASYNIYANIFTGSDITVLSNHLFFGHFLLDWAWSEEPFKTAWVIREDGIMLSLTYVKEQELIGWAHHDTNGQFTSVCSVVETVASGVVDAVYVIVQRQINGVTVSYVERMADRYFPYGYEDSWSVDCALQTQPLSSNVNPGGLVDYNATVTASTGAVGPGATFTTSDNSSFLAGWVFRFGGGVAVITNVINSSTYTCTITRAFQDINPYTGVPYPAQPFEWTIWQPVTTVSGLTQLVGQSVVGVADGAVVGPLVVSASGTVTLPNAASKVTLGLAYTPQLMTLSLDLGEPTVQSKRKKVPAATLRCADALGLQIGTSFANAVTVKDLQLGAIPSQSNGVAVVNDLVNPSWNPGATLVDARQILDQLWQEPGQLCVQQNLPYPATILGVMPEVVVGDTPK